LELEWRARKEEKIRGEQLERQIRELKLNVWGEREDRRWRREKAERAEHE
jgi:hypothetical protein